MLCLPAYGQDAAEPALPPVPAAAASEFDNRPIRTVTIQGNQRVSDETILNLIRTDVGTQFDHLTVQEDYQRLDATRRFRSVTADVVPTADGGVDVVFIVSELRPIESITFRGNRAVDDETLRSLVDLNPGEAVDQFRISLAQQSIETFYEARNFPLTRVSVDAQAAADTGELVFTINEGPNVRVRNIDFIGNESFSEDALKKQIRSRTWIPLLRRGTFDEDAIEDDVALLVRFYESKGFFDAKVGRRLRFSANQREVQVEFLVDEGPRYTIDAIRFVGNNIQGEQQLRELLKAEPGMAYDDALIRRDVRRVVESYAPFGRLFDPQSNDPDYLQVTARPQYKLEPGSVDLVFEINEGEPFRVGNVIVRGNRKTQDKVALRELRLAPGDLYDTKVLLQANERLLSVPSFADVRITPVGKDPNFRDLIVEVEEAQTATVGFAAGVNSNGGFGGTISYTQRNFDITNVPGSWDQIRRGEAFTGAGQTLSIRIEPGDETTNASILFTEPYLFDQPYSLTTEAFIRNRSRTEFNIGRSGARITLGRFLDEDRVYSISGTARIEDVDIFDIPDEEIRAFEILAEEGNTTLDSLSVLFRRNTTDSRFVPTTGTILTAGADFYGLLGGNENFQRYTATFDWFILLNEDLRDRKTVFRVATDVGFITGDAPFFERFFEGGIRSVRGFAFRGISPRSGPDDDRIGGEFSFVGTAEIEYPLLSDALRGVAFVDFGTNEMGVDFDGIRTAAGAGVRLTLPVFGQVPIAIDFGFPITSEEEDDIQLVSFSLGYIP
ncbi:MAG: outer membrane protein assembly factor BamA [Planctomycetota bacterium]